MPPKLSRRDTEASLLLSKRKLLQELDYYDRRIKETRQILSVAPTSLIEDDDSSDSDTGLLEAFHIAPPIPQLKRKEAMLKTCLHATLELNHLELLQHQMDNLVAPPELNGEPLVEEKGSWREVAAECCVDMVPFSITFYTFRADRKFAPTLFRCLKVIPHKPSQEVELANSVLHRLHTPSEAVKLIYNYSVAYRSRRSTLARLADKFGATLHMDPLPGGGYALKCGSALEVTWSLQNKGSPIAPFHHKLKFDIDYMDEQYIKIITQAHRQLSDPSIDTDSRTLLLAKIIDTCLQACPQTAPDTEVMAPPKSLPKKAKPKNKEEKVSSQKATKRPAQEEISVDTAKKIKTTQNIDQNNKEIGQEDELPPKSTNDTAKSAKSAASSKKSQKNVVATKKTDKNVANSVENDINTEKDNVATAKNDNLKENTQKSAQKANKLNEKNLETEQNDELPKSAKSTNDKQKKSVRNQDKTKSNTQNEENLRSEKNKDIIPKSTKSGTDKQKKITPNKDKTNIVASAKDDPTKTDKTKTKTANKNDVTVDTASDIPAKRRKTEEVSTEKSVKNPKLISSKPDKTVTEKKVKNQDLRKTTSEKTVKNQENVKTTNKNSVKNVNENKVTNVTDNLGKQDKNIPNSNEATKKLVKPHKVTSKINTGISEKNDIKNTNNTEQNTKITNKKSASNTNKENTVQNVATAKNINQKASTTNVKKTIPNADKLKKPLQEQNPKISKPTIPVAKATKILPTQKDVKTGNTEKGQSVINTGKASKIPQKKIKTPKLIKKPIRVSPRKPLTNPKLLVGTGANMKKAVQNPVTGIPRLMTKPKPRVD